MTSSKARDKLATIEARIKAINEAAERTDSDNFDYFSGLELDHLDKRKSILHRIIQRQEMKEQKI